MYLGSRWDDPSVNRILESYSSMFDPFHSLSKRPCHPIVSIARRLHDRLSNKKSLKLSEKTVPDWMNTSTKVLSLLT
jgi:hypothetical protein